MNIKKAYSDWSATYDADRNLTRDLDQFITRSTFSGRHFDTILEIGCGTGKNTQFYSEIAECVYALDFSNEMLNIARTKLQSANVHFILADITTGWPCRDNAVNFAACHLVLEHVRDLTSIFSEAYRVLLPGGSFFVSELHPFRQYQGTQANFQKHGQPVQIDAFVHHLSDFTNAAFNAGFALRSLDETRHTGDMDLPRLVSFVFEKKVRD